MVQEIYLRFPSLADQQVTAQVHVKLYQEQAFTVTTENYTLQYRLEQGLAPKMYAQITIREGTQALHTVRLPFTVAVFAPVLHARGHFDTGTVATENMFYVRSANIVEKLNAVVYKTSLLDGQRLRTTLSQDQLVQRWMFEKVPVVSLGDIITVVVLTDEVQLRMTAEVLQSGFVGDKIRVRLRPTKKLVRVKIKAPGEYEVQL